MGSFKKYIVSMLWGHKTINWNQMVKCMRRIMAVLPANLNYVYYDVISDVYLCYDHAYFR